MRHELVSYLSNDMRRPAVLRVLGDWDIFDVLVSDYMISDISLRWVEIPSAGSKFIPPIEILHYKQKSTFSRVCFPPGNSSFRPEIRVSGRKFEFPPRNRVL